MIVKLVLLLVLGFAPAFGGNWCDMECFFSENIKKKGVLEEKDLDFCKKFASVLISELKPAVLKCHKLFNEECEREVSSSAYDSDADDHSSELEKLLGFAGWWLDDLAMIETKGSLPKKCLKAVALIHSSNIKEWVSVCDNALAVLSQ